MSRPSSPRVVLSAFKKKRKSKYAKKHIAKFISVC
jgi:hypothetical protein